MEPSNYLSQRPSRTQGTLLSDLHALNRQFLSLLLAGPEAADGGGLNDCLIGALGTLNDEQLARLANCPYSLFDLAFADEQAWQPDAQPATTRDRLVSTPPDRCIDPDHAAFSLAALMYARQMSDSFPDMTRLLLGMSEEVMRLFADLTLVQVTRSAFAGKPPLRARLHAHPNFWADIIDFVRDGTRERHLAAQTRGVQHCALKL